MLMTEGFTDLLKFAPPPNFLCCPDQDLSMRCEEKKKNKTKTGPRCIVSWALWSSSSHLSSSLHHPPGLISCGAVVTPLTSGSDWSGSGRQRQPLIDFLIDSSGMEREPLWAYTSKKTRIPGSFLNLCSPVLISWPSIPSFFPLKYTRLDISDCGPCLGPCLALPWCNTAPPSPPSTHKQWEQSKKKKKKVATNGSESSRGVSRKFWQGGSGVELRNFARACFNQCIFTIFVFLYITTKAERSYYVTDKQYTALCGLALWVVCRIPPLSYGPGEQWPGRRSADRGYLITS